MTAELDGTTKSPWTPEELSSIREGLEAAVARLQTELHLLDDDMTGLASGSGGEALPDDLDVASHRSEMLQDAVQAENTAAILEQTQHVLQRLTRGMYGLCEECSASISRARLQAFPRATLCMGCAS